MSPTTHWAPALLLALSLTLAGCGKDGNATKDEPARRETATANTTQTPSPSPVIPKGATVVKGQGYSFAMPAGWQSLTKEVKKEQASVDVAVGSKVQTEGFTNNLNVVLTASGGADEDDLDSIAKQIQASLAPSAPDYAIGEHTSVAGLPTAHLSGVRIDGKQRYWLEQFVVIGPKQSQVISFSFAEATPPAKRNQLITQVLKSWAISN